jgi:nitrogen fixation/metabolism regulation signal transduction histidine kinase
LLLVVLAAIAAGFVLADAMSAPLLRLARGTQAVAAGDFTPLSEPSGKDDLAVLTRSFNHMLAELGSARGALTQNNAYLQQVLSSLTTGVLVIDAQQTLRSINPSAVSILRLSKPRLQVAAAQQLPAAVWQAIVAKQGKTHWQAQIEHIPATGETQTLLLRAAPLAQNDGLGILLVFDDVSATMLAQKAQAWAEVAQRLAHEIKNPLTPIQLSAERLVMKLSDKLTGKDVDLLKRSTATIITQVAALKNMVDEFKQFSRLPQAQLIRMDLNSFLTEELVLYKGKITWQLIAEHDKVLADPNQLRQVLHNLLGNALDAAQDRYNNNCHTVEIEGLLPQPQVELITQNNAEGLCLRVNDNGAGFSSESLAKLFEPYHTTKAQGTGLGLAIVHRIVQEHHAKIHVYNRTNSQNNLSSQIICNTIEGATVEIIFPFFAIEPISIASIV